MIHMNNAATVISALGIGILTAIHPCLIALNISALAMINGYSKTSGSSLFQAVFYLVGRAWGYTFAAFIVAYGLLSVPAIALFLQNTIHRFAGPLLILVGMMFAGLLSFGGVPAKATTAAGLDFSSARLPYLRIALVGMIHALSFCPTSAGIYFGVLLPGAASRGSMLLLSSVYGIGTGLPMVTLLALSNMGIGFFTLKDSRIAQFWIPRLSGVVLILAGVYLTIVRMFGVWT